MTQEILKENYIILSETPYNNKCVVICREKKTYKYTFFFKENDLYSQVDIQLEKVLTELFETKYKNIHELRLSQNAYKNSEDILSEFKLCASHIRYLTKDLPPAYYERIVKKLNSINVYTFNEYIDRFKLDKNIFVNTHALYDYENNILVYKYLSTPIILHELLHCASTSSDKLDVGFCRTVTGGDIGRSLNEYYTEYLVSKAFSVKSNYVHYEIFDQLLSPIAPSLKEDFFKHDYISALSKIAFYYNMDFYEVEEIILKADAVIKASRIDVFDKSPIGRLKTDIFKGLIEDLYVDIAQIILNKKISENEDITNFKLQTRHHIFDYDLFPDTKARIEARVNELVEEATNTQTH